MLNLVSHLPLVLLSDLASSSVFFNLSASVSPCKVWNWGSNLGILLDIKQQFCKAMRSIGMRSWLSLHKTWCKQVVLVLHRERSSVASCFSAIEADCPAPREHAYIRVRNFAFSTSIIFFYILFLFLWTSKLDHCFRGPDWNCNDIFWKCFVEPGFTRSVGFVVWYCIIISFYRFKRKWLSFQSLKMRFDSRNLLDIKQQFCKAMRFLGMRSWMSLQRTWFQQSCPCFAQRALMLVVSALLTPIVHFIRVQA